MLARSVPYGAVSAQPNHKNSLAKKEIKDLLCETGDQAQQRLVRTLGAAHGGNLPHRALTVRLRPVDPGRGEALREAHPTVPRPRNPV